jgi:hypothetical protein
VAQRGEALPERAEHGLSAKRDVRVGAPPGRAFEAADLDANDAT